MVEEVFSCLSVGLLLLVCNTSPRRHPDSILVRSPKTCWGAASVLWMPPRWLDSSPDRSGETALGEGSILLLVSSAGRYPELLTTGESRNRDHSGQVQSCRAAACIWLYHLYLAGIYQPHALRQAPSSPEKLHHVQTAGFNIWRLDHQALYPWFCPTHIAFDPRSAFCWWRAHKRVNSCRFSLHPTGPNGVRCSYWVLPTHTWFSVM